MALRFPLPSTRSLPCSLLWLRDSEASSSFAFCSDWANPPIGLLQRKSFPNGFQSRNAAGLWHSLTAVLRWVGPSLLFSSSGCTFISAVGNPHSFWLERLGCFGSLHGDGSTILLNITQRSAWRNGRWFLANERPERRRQDRQEIATGHRCRVGFNYSSYPKP